MTRPLAALVGLCRGRQPVTLPHFVEKRHETTAAAPSGLLPTGRQIFALRDEVYAEPGSLHFRFVIFTSLKFLFCRPGCTSWHFATTRVGEV